MRAPAVLPWKQALLAALALTATARAEQPAWEIAADRLLVAALPAEVLASSEVKPRLTSGLTTSLAIEVTATDARGHRLRGGGLIEVRYELWDEVFLVSAVGGDGRPQKVTVPSFDRLIAWWQSLKLPVLAVGRSLGAGPWRVEAHLTVAPFSRTEQAQTQEWLSRSVAAPASDSVGEAAPAPGPAGGVLDMLVATSIKRRSLVTFDWHGVAAAPAQPPQPPPAAGAPP